MDSDSDSEHDNLEHNQRLRLSNDDSDSDAKESANTDASQDVSSQDGIETNEQLDDEQFTPFNLKDELREGDFDDNGFYLQGRKDPGAVEDQWLAGNSSKSDIAKAKQTRDRLELRRAAFEKLNEQTQSFGRPIEYYLGQILEGLEPQETLVSALARRQKLLEKSSAHHNYEPAWKRKIREKKAAKLKTLVESSLVGEESDYKAVIEQINHLTTAAGALIEHGMVDIYDESFEKIRQRLIAGKVLPETWNIGDPIPILNNYKIGALKEQKLWEYKWSANSDEVFGPYQNMEMKAWKQAGYFKDGIYIRQVTESTSLNPQSGFKKLETDLF